MENVVLKCIKCNELLMKPPGEMKRDQLIGLVCGNKDCDRFGLITVVGKSEKKEESSIIVPGQAEFDFKGGKDGGINKV